MMHIRCVLDNYLIYLCFIILVVPSRDCHLINQLKEQYFQASFIASSTVHKMSTYSTILYSQ